MCWLERLVLLALQLGGEVPAGGRVPAGGGQPRHQVLQHSSGHGQTPGISLHHCSETWVTFLVQNETKLGMFLAFLLVFRPSVFLVNFVTHPSYLKQ